MGLGLAFSRQQVALCRAGRRRGRIEVAQALTAPLPAGALEPAFGRPNLVDPEACEAALATLLAGARIGRSAAAVALPDPSLRVRLLPQAPRGGTRAEAGRLVAWQLRDTLPFAPEQARADCAPTGDGGALCLVGAEAVVSQYEALLARRRLVPVHLGAASLALWSLFETAAARPGREPDGTACRLALFVEEGHATLVAAAGGRPALWRFLAGAGGGSGTLAREVGDSLHALAEAGRLSGGERLAVHAPAGWRDEVASALQREVDLPVEALAWPPGAPADPSLLPALGAALVA